MKEKLLGFLERAVRKPCLGRRLAAVTFATLTMAFSMSLLETTNFGTDPFTAMNIGISEAIGLSLGTWQCLLNLILFCIVVRFDVSRLGIGTLYNMILTGYAMDFFRWLWKHTIPAAVQSLTVYRVGLLVVMLTLFIFAVSLYMSVELGAGAYDALPLFLGDSYPNVPFRLIRILWDVSATGLGLLFHGPVGPVTVITAFTLGPVIALVGKWIQPLFREAAVPERLSGAGSR